MAVALFDTNILIDFLKGYKPAIDEIEYWDDAVISSIYLRAADSPASRGIPDSRKIFGICNAAEGLQYSCRYALYI